MDKRAFLADLFQAAVDAADPKQALRDVLPPKPAGRTVVIAIGKGAAQLAAAFEESLWSGGRSVFHLALETDDLHQPAPGELNLRPISFGRMAALLAAGQVVLAVVPFADDYTNDERLVLPGLESIPTAQARFTAGETEIEDRAWTLDRQEETRAHHDALKSRLEALIA